MAATLDTLRAAKRLKEARDDDARAEVIVELLRETQEAGLAQLVTKAELRAELAELRAELRAEMAELRTELRAEMAELRMELRTGLADTRGEIARAQNRLLIWLLPLLFTQVGGLLYLILRPLLGGS